MEEEGSSFVKQTIYYNRLCAFIYYFYDVLLCLLLVYRYIYIYIIIYWSSSLHDRSIKLQTDTTSAYDLTNRLRFYDVIIRLVVDK